jgi:predicted RNA-binding protein associated with RNAse of E/G family
MHLGKIKYWYCDIIDYIKELDKITLIDLLVDLKIYEDERIEVLDLDELDEAYDKCLISSHIYLDAINKLNKLIKMVSEKEGIEKLVEYLLKASE